MVQVRFYSPHLRHEIPFYTLQWRRSPTQKRTCAIYNNTCTRNTETSAISRDTCARNTETCAICRDTCTRNTETCTICRDTCTKTAAPAPTRA